MVKVAREVENEVVELLDQKKSLEEQLDVGHYI